MDCWKKLSLLISINFFIYKRRIIKYLMKSLSNMIYSFIIASTISSMSISLYIYLYISIEWTIIVWYLYKLTNIIILFSPWKYTLLTLLNQKISYLFSSNGKLYLNLQNTSELFWITKSHSNVQVFFNF